jgi:amino acid adenylation domain-containing protein/non-ribosomal peptide synthase protein (TIGR01720 family)
MIDVNINKAIAVVAKARENGVHLFLEGEKIKFKTPRNAVVSPELLTEIKQYRDEIKVLLNDTVSLHGEDENGVITAGAVGATDGIRLSFSQERLWFIDQLEGSVKYHIPVVMTLKGPLQLAALRDALKQIVSRHEVLRTVFRETDGIASQLVLDKDSWELQVISAPEYYHDPVALNAAIQAMIDTPFDLSADHMLRAYLLAPGTDEYVLVVVMHHIAADGWSTGIIVKELIALYRAAVEGTDPVLPAPEIQYADYALWQRKYLSGSVLEGQLRYWREKLSGTPALELPPDYPRPAIQSNRGAIVSFDLGRDITDQVKAFSRQQGVTVFMTLLAAFKVLLYRYTGQEDICVGTPVAGRTRKEVDHLIGFFINTLALRSDLSEQPTFTALLQQVKQTTLGAYDHQDLPFEKIVEAVVKERDLARNPLFQVMFALQNAPAAPELELNGVTFSYMETAHNTAKFDLTFSLEEVESGFSGRIEYCTDLFSESTMHRMSGHFRQLLHSILAQPDTRISVLPLLTVEERQQALTTFNNTTVAYADDQSVPKLFAAQVLRNPDAVAVMYGDATLSYRSLHERSNQLAHYLQSKGVRKESLVPVCIERSLEMMIGILAILKAGGAYVPLDPAYPADRLNLMLTESNSPLLLTTTSFRERFTAERPEMELLFLDQLTVLSGDQSTADISSLPSPDHLAYVIYTSGSTGKPKGVMVTHRNITSLVLQPDYVSLKETDVILSAGSLSFDATTFEYWGMLLNGGRLVLSAENSLLDSSILKQELYSKQVTVLFITTSWFNQLVDTDITVFAQLLVILTGGEKMSEKHVERFRETYPDISISNIYGPTENTTFSLSYHINSQGLNANIPIGVPLNNRTAYVLDAAQQLVPVGVAGELCVGGAGLARGYLDRPALTAEKFIRNPFSEVPGAGLYRTGDRARWLPDGNIVYLGRIDDQVKIRGFRVEPGETESVLLACELVTQAVVVVKTDEREVKRLVAYIVPAGNFNREGITSYLKEKLPDYMVPSVLVPMEKLPVTANGKIDKKALPEPDMAGQLTHGFVAPVTQAGKDMALIWEELLGIERVGIYDNFFELGGDSIITIQVVSRARRAGYTLHPKDLFMHQTIERLEGVLSAKRKLAVTGEQGLLNGDCGLLPVQQWFFNTNAAAANHFNQSTLLGVAKSVTPSVLSEAIKILVRHHDALRFVYHEDENGWHQTYGTYESALEVADLQHIAAPALSDAITSYSRTVHSSLDIKKGILIRPVLLLTGPAETYNILLIVIHHLAVDGVSWRILLEDLEILLKNAAQLGKATLSPDKGNSYRQWCNSLLAYSQRRRLTSQLTHWEKVVTTGLDTPLRTDKFYDGNITIADLRSLETRLDASFTLRLLQEAPRAYHTVINDILLSALTVALCKWNDSDRICIGLEGHGREDISSIDTSRTVGWFTSLYPVLLESDATGLPGNTLRAVKEQLRAVPDKGIGFGVLKQMVKAPLLQGKDPWDIVFNYLGQSDRVVTQQGALSLVNESSGSGLGENYVMQEKISVNSVVRDGELVLIWTFSSRHYEEQSIQELSAAYISQLQILIDHCVDQESAVFTPSDYGLNGIISNRELDDFLDAMHGSSCRREQISGLYRLSGLQEGMLFHSLYDETSGAYIEQFCCDLVSLQPAAFETAWEHLLQQHSILRTAFYNDEAAVPLQCVFKEVILPLEILDYRYLDAAAQQQALQDYALADSRKAFDITIAPLMRITLIRLENDRYRLLWTFHHILFDGWSIPILVEELLRAYEAIVNGETLPAVPEDRYEDFIRYIGKQDKEQEELYWRGYMNGVEEATLLPFIKPGADRTKASGDYKDKLLHFDAAVTAGITSYVHRQRVTVNTLMQGVWAYLLYRYTGHHHIAYGVTVSGRPEDLPGIEQRVGMYINTIPLHASIAEDKLLSQWLQELQADQLRSREFQYTGLDAVQRWSGVPGDLFDTLLVFENYPVSKVIDAQTWQLQVEQVAVQERTNYPLSIMIGAGANINIRFSYNSSLLPDVYMDAIAGHFETVILQLLRHGDARLQDIKWLPETAEQQLLTAFNNTAVSWPGNKTLVDLFTDQVLRTPQATAVVFEDAALSYRELDMRTNQLAHYLNSQGVKKETLVPVCLERSLDMIIAIVGILKAGGAYVPVDPTYPQERIAHMLADTHAGVILSDKASAAALPVVSSRIILLDEEQQVISNYSAAAPQQDIDPRQLAYVIYTSGSTGLPKGVMNEHAGVVNRLLWTQQYFELTGADAVLQKTTFCFDVSVWELLWPLICGAKLVMAVPDGQKDTDYLKAAINRYDITTLHFVPAMLNIFLENISPGDGRNLQRVLCSGEALKPQQVMSFREKFPHAALYNLYGPTEAAIDVTCWHDSGDIAEIEVVPIGKPVANTQLYILDKTGNVLPAGVYGELHIGGTQVARGYLNREALTTEKFIPDPFRDIPGARMYKTGDLCRWLPDGNIEYAGRIDQQVKIRGYRIELGEIESVLLESGVVTEAVVAAKDAADGSKRLIGYVVPSDGFDRNVVMDGLRRRLPEYMIPVLLIELTALPLTASGKVDRKALPDPDAASLMANVYVAPRNDAEEVLATIWQDILGVSRVGVNDDFFALGGNSLMAMRLVSALRKQLQVELPVKSIFTYATIAQLSAYILQHTPAAPLLPAVEAGQRPARIPLSFSQERLWFIDQLEGSVQYHIPVVLRLKGTLNNMALAYALQSMVNRHEVLRTVIEQEDGKAWQRVLEMDRWQLHITDEPVYRQDAGALSSFVQSLVHTPFDLATDHMLRAHLLVLSEEEHVLVVVIHHISSDGWSSSIIVKELVALYQAFINNEVSDLPALPLQYADYAIWQRRYLTDKVLAVQLEYWKEKLHGTAVLQLPADYSRPAVQSTCGAVTWFRLDKELSDQLRVFSQQQQVTLFMTLLAAFKVLLYRYSGQEDICVGSPVAGRTRQETESLIGFFINTLALRSHINGQQPFTALLEQVKETTLGAYEHQEIPFEKIVEAVTKERDLSRSPLFQVMFVLQNMPPVPVLTLGDLELSGEPLSYATTQYDLSFSLEDSLEGLSGNVEYCVDVFSPDTIDRMIRHFKQLLQGILQLPSTAIQVIPMLAPDEEEQLLITFNNSNREAPELTGKTLAQLFTEQVSRTPAAIALVFENTALTYQELEERSGQLARFLNHKGVKPGTLVPLCVERSLHMMVAILGILKAGGAYVPVDPHYPQERIRMMLDDIKSSIIVTTSAQRHLFSNTGHEQIIIDEWPDTSAHQDLPEVTVTATLDDPAYVIYTSGSTGKPKGVIIHHAAIVNFISHRSRDFGIDATDRVLQFSNYCFDAAVEQMFLPLINGAVLVLIPEVLRLDRQYFEQLLEQEKITHLDTTPGFLSSITPGNYGSLRRVVSGGEAGSLQLAEAWGSYVDFYNEYGPTETTVVATGYLFHPQQLHKRDMLPIGKPLANVRIYILDAAGQLLPPGVAGELYIGGIQVAKGYLHMPALTAEKFVADRFSGNGAKLYKTGDLACWLPDGNIACLGRTDDQVKIRGYRIELGEIENVLLQLEGIREALVLVKADINGHKRLIGYIAGDQLPAREDITAYLSGRLPEYMIPPVFITLENLPLTPNGKVDRKALPEPDTTALAINTYVPPRNETEEALAGIWQDLLGIQRAGINDNFFELGGDSIITIQVVSRARRAGYELHPADLFKHQTIAALSALLLSQQQTGDRQGEQGVLTGASGLLPVQQWYFDQISDHNGEQHFNQGILLELDKRVDIPVLESAITALLSYHDALRFVYSNNGPSWEQAYGMQEGMLEVADLRSAAPDELAENITALCEQYQRSLYIAQGIVIRTVFIQTPDAAPRNRLLIVIHHLTVDGVSWRILLEDLELLLKNDTRQKGAALLGPKSSSYRQWYNALTAYGQSNRVQAQREYWKQVVENVVPLVTEKIDDGNITISDTANHMVRLNAWQTKRLLQEAPRAYHTEINDILLCALALTLSEWNHTSKVVIGLEGHGREPVAAAIDTSRTVGWFTSLYPLKLDITTATTGPQLKSVKEQLRKVPDKGLGYGVLKYINREACLQGNDPWDIVFNYLGQSGNIVAAEGWLGIAAESPGSAVGKDFPVAEKIAIDGMVQEDELVLRWKYSSKHFSAAGIEKLGAAYITHLDALIEHCAAQPEVSFTPSDFGLGKEISVEELDAFLDSPHGTALRRTQVDGLYRLTGLQEAMLFHGLYDERSGAYIEQFAGDLLNPDIAAFEQSWNALLRQHSALRSSFYYDEFSIPVQCVYKQVLLPVTILDYSDLPEEEQQKALHKYTAADRVTGFDFKAAPLMRLTLICLDESRYRMLWTSHHILFDGWSLPLILEELLRMYESIVKQTPLPVVAEDRYEHYIRSLEYHDKETEELFWRNYLKEVTEATLLPFIGVTEARNSGAGTYKQAYVQLDAATTKHISRFAQRHRITPNTIMQGVWAYLLHRYTGRADVSYGITVSGRPESLPGVEHAVGMYINTLPLCAKVTADKPVKEWLQEIQASQLQCREYQYTPLDAMQRWTGISGDWFDSLLVYENYPVSKVLDTQTWLLEIDNVAVHEQTNLPLEILVAVSDTIRITFRYNADMLAENYAAAIAGHFEQVLKQMTGNDGITLRQLNILTTAEHDLLTKTFNSKKASIPQHKTIIHLIRQQAARMPEATAVIFEKEELTYQVLEQKSDQLAHYLRSQGVKAGSPVPICMERSLEMLVGILGIMKAGGAYVPIDPAYPPERIGFILRDVAATIVVSSTLLQQKIAMAANVPVIALNDSEGPVFSQALSPLVILPAPDDLAYIIYTSGSTGTPKGVLIEHRGMLNHLYAKIKDLRINHHSVIAFTASYTFDISVWQMFAALLCGGSTIIYPDELILNPEALIHAVDRQQVSILELVPSYLAAVMQEQIPAKLEQLKYLLVTGEAASQQVLAQWFTHPHYHRIPVVNAYGPTEASDDICHYVMRDIPKQSNIPLGYPIQNLRIYITSAAMQLCPVGVPGEICVSGVGVGRGYLNRPELTAEKFITDPFITTAGVRMYRTGDLGRWLPDGTIEYLGRIDDQVKLRGYRIELGEIEYVLEHHESIQQAVVVAKADSRGNKQLVGYVVPDADFDRDVVNKYLKERLPEYMVPALLITLEKLPLTANGKTDKQALPSPDEVQGWSSQSYVAPRNETEALLANVWQELLGVETVGVQDNFFELGGHSLQVIRLISMVRKKLQVEVTVRTFFQLATIEQLARYIKVNQKNTLEDDSHLETISL